MAPKKKNADKGADKGAAQPPPGTAPEQNDQDNAEEENVNHESMMEDFALGPAVALECMGEIMDLAMARIHDKHIEEHTDAFTATAACEALVDLTDWLHLTCEEDAKLDEFEDLCHPQPLNIDSWAEGSGQGETLKFGTDKKDEVLGMYGSQRGVVAHADGTHQSLMPEWLRKDSRPASSIAATSMYSSTHIPVNKLKKKANTSIAARANSQLSKQASANSLKNAKSASSASLRSRASVQEAVAPTKPTSTPDSGAKKMSAGRLRQFRRRSEQHKAEKQQAVLNMKPKVPANRLDPISAHHQNLPSVQIVDPNQEALDARRKALKNGKVRPQTKSELKLVQRGSPQKSSPKKKKSPQKPAASKVQQALSQRALGPIGESSSQQQHVSALPETLVDSLAISDGSLAASILEQNIGDDFDRLKPVSIPIV